MARNVQKYLSKVLQSSEFQNSSKYRKLLEYLVTSTLEGNVPKEITIAMELFGLEMRDDVLGESNIRVYIHNVRKKLDTYYINEGKADKIQFKIPKGRYKVEFVRRQDVRRIFSRRSLIVIGSVVAVLIIANIFFLWLYLSPDSGIVRSKYSKWIWEDIIRNEDPLIVVIGDYYLIEDVTFNDRSRFIRDVRINSEHDLNKFLLEYPEYNELLSRTNHTFMGKYAIICINELGKIMNSAGKNFRIILASDFQWHNLKNYNVVYIGSFKSLGIMGQLIKNSNFKFNLYPNELKFHELETDSVFHYYPFGSDIEDASETDYCIVTKLPGSGQQDVFMFLSVRDIGLIATMDYFTNEETLETFENILKAKNQDADYFEACFKIQGLDRNSMSIELLHINRFSPSSLFKINPGVDD